MIKLRFPEEILISVSGHYCPVVYGGGHVIRSLTFKRNKRTFGPFGVEEGTPFNVLANGGHIVGFYGRSGWHLDSLGFCLSTIKPNLFQRIQMMFGMHNKAKGSKERSGFEMGVVVPKHQIDCVEVVVDEFHKVGLLVDRVAGLDHQFLKLAAPVEILGKATVDLQMKKKTQIGVDLQFQLNAAEAFTKQIDGSLFSWLERFRCYNHMIYGIVNKTDSAVVLKSNGRDVKWEPGESLVWKLEKEGIVKEVFPIHDEMKRKQLLKRWALNWWDLTNQPLDEIYAYYGAKIATYFALLGMYAKWLFFPAALGIIVQSVDFGSLQFLVLPFFFICIISWAVFFFQFWKRKNSTLLARWQICYSGGAESAYKSKEKEKIQREEWSARVLRFRNDAVIILSITCLQLPFELAYAHLYESIGSDIIKFVLTAVYLYAIQYFTQIGGKASVKLTKDEKNENSEYKANSLVYKVFGMYFMQSYIGLLYHAILHRNFTTLRRVIIQRLIISEVAKFSISVSKLGSYNLLKLNTFDLKMSPSNKRKREKGMAARKSSFNSRVEKEYLKPKYSASVGDELEDGLFDEFLELALQFGMIMMFACAFPAAFAFAALSSITQIRADALKVLAMYRRPVPRVAATIGAWLNIFQFLIVVSICTNCILLVCLYDTEGNWNISPGLVAILIVEHVLLLIKFGFSRIVPEEPDWVKADRMKNATQAQNMCSKQLLSNISGGRTLVTSTENTD
ncbi:hypothetical protein L1987_52035 [Smallanthus sonchifolius]|uniref:Uncharacterized protein n=1 Tax=Smallanthus sonchifolius TaxID=185202 RepID=A0ACB9ERZ2_9ASTR|nr:hypothetical protein L1987_52035 [Smallanthus sonchifolius]